MFVIVNRLHDGSFGIIQMFGDDRATRCTFCINFCIGELDICIIIINVMKFCLYYIVFVLAHVQL